MNFGTPMAGKNEVTRTRIPFPIEITNKQMQKPGQNKCEQFSMSSRYQSMKGNDPWEMASRWCHWKVPQLTALRVSKLQHGRDNRDGALQTPELRRWSWESRKIKAARYRMEYRRTFWICRVSSSMGIQLITDWYIHVRNVPERMEGNSISRNTQGLEYFLLPSRLGNLFNSGPFGRVFRRSWP